MKRKITIAVADDQKMFRSGLVSMLNDLPNVEVIHEASDGKELMNLLRGKEPHIIFLDYRMPQMNGITAARMIRDKYPAVRILMLSMFDDEEFVVSAIENGANGYLTKDDEPEEIHRAIESVLNTGYYANDRTSKILISKLMTTGQIQPEFPLIEEEDVSLTDNQIELIRLIAKEFSTKEIAQKLHKSERTVEKSRARIMEKVGAKNSIGLVMYAIKNGLLNP